MGESLILLRCVGAIFGLSLFIWSFNKLRVHAIQTREFLLTTIISLCITTVAIFPNCVNIFSEMFLVKDQQFGRLITLLVLSNFLIWILVIGLRAKHYNKSTQFDLLCRRLAQKYFIKNNKKLKLSDITVIIPALNEAENLNIILPRMPKNIMGHSVGVLVVDDGSDDATVETVLNYGHTVISNIINRGGGAALRLGYDIANLLGCKIIVTMDGDGQHQPEEIENIVRPIIDNKANIVIGSRLLGGYEKDNWVRIVGIYAFNFMINTLAGTKISDCSNGFRAFEVESLTKIFLVQDQFHTAELIIEAAKKKLSITEAPITVLKRHSGSTKKGKNFNYGINFFKTVIKTWFR